MKTNEKLVWVVRGSEDGNLGVFTNLKTAYAKCESYIKSSGTGEAAESYATVCKKLRDALFFSVSDKNSRTQCDIEGFYLNNL